MAEGQLLGTIMFFEIKIKKSARVSADSRRSRVRNTSSAALAQRRCVEIDGQTDVALSAARSRRVGAEGGASPPLSQKTTLLSIMPNNREAVVWR